MIDTKQIDDGGPAFPGTSLDTEVRAALLKTPANYSATDATRIASFHGGMTLRDWFAANTPLTPAELDLVMSRKGSAQHSEEALLRYQKADAMIAARKEKV